MSLEISIASRAEQDMPLQYRWYLENADFDVAERYLLAVHETIQSIAGQPDLGIRRHFAAPELARIRSIQVRRPFDRHLLFDWDGALCALSASCMGPEICRAGSWKSRKADHDS